MSDDQHQLERGPFGGCLAVAALVLPIIYVQLIGPVGWLNYHGYLSDDVTVVYDPLRYLNDNCKPIGSFLEWYLGLWGVP